MKKVLVTSVVTLATALFLSTGHAGNGKHKHGKRGGNGSSAVISYSIDAIDCAVTINSTKDLSNIVLKDSDGNRVKKWDGLDGKSFSDFGMYSALLTDGSLFVKSGNNGTRGKRNRGLGAEIGDDFRDELAACLDDSGPVCPAVVTEKVDAAIASVSDADLWVVDNGISCQIFGTSAVSVFNGLSVDNGFQIGAVYQADDGTFVSVDLTLEEAEQCVVYIDRCDNYDDRL